MTKKWTVLLALLLSFGLPAAAQASLISIGLQQAGVNGGAITTVASGDAPTGTGRVLTYGSFANTINASGDLLPGDKFTTQSINTNTSNAAGTLSVWVTETGITDPTGPNKLVSDFTLNNTSGAFSSIAENTYFDASNAAYGTATPLSNASLTSLVNYSETNGPLDLTSPYSVTEAFTITMTGSGTSTATISMGLPKTSTSVPAPGSLWLMGAGLALLGLLLGRRRLALR